MNRAYTQGKIVLSFSSLRSRRLLRRPSDGTSSVTGLSQSAVPTDHRQYIKCIFNICFSRFNEENLVSILQALLPQVFKSMDSLACTQKREAHTVSQGSRLERKFGQNTALTKSHFQQSQHLPNVNRLNFLKRCFGLISQPLIFLYHKLFPEEDSIRW